MDKVYFIIDADTYEIRSQPFLRLDVAERKLKHYEKIRDFYKLHGKPFKEYTIRNYEILDCDADDFDESYIEELKEEQKYCDELNKRLNKCTR